MIPGADIAFCKLDGEQAAAGFGELRALYTEPPYGWGEEHADLFAERFEVQRRQEGFALVEARDGTELAGLAFGVTLQPSTPWRNNLTTTLLPEVTTERPGRTFALVEMLVRAPWRRRHATPSLHDLLLENHPEERATLTVLPAGAPAQAAYRKWGWHRVACLPHRPPSHQHIRLPGRLVPGKPRGPTGGHMRMHARLGGKRQARTAPGTGTGTPSSGYPHRSLAPIPVRYASVDTATQRPTALQGDTPRDRDETPR